ncbi:S-adenosyl-L-methionine-dependent methyltransferase [Clavulina sp. PMI_390]|nr:S-adenosyl-L-methionine-dependent methyltransferase [Clavulina sp. PMI_390]
MPKLSPVQLDASRAAQNEAEYVHGVYDDIADHFSQTRYKPWPLIERFLATLEPGSIGLDSGTGNGKYLPLNLGGKIHMVGLDRSINLLNIARRAGGVERDVVWGDALGLGWRMQAFDFAISIATIHHLSTPERRCEAIKSILRCLNPRSGRLLLYVWAVEQDELSKRVVPEADNGRSLPSNASGTPIAPESEKEVAKAQDVLVPWVRSAPPQTAAASSSMSTAPVPEASQSPSRDAPKVFQRYYHLFAASELPELFCKAAEELGIPVGPPPSSSSEPSTSTSASSSQPDSTRGVEIVNTGWERSNYYLEARMWRQPSSP